MSKKALGRGLDALIGTDFPSSEESGSIQELNLKDIIPNPDQPRKSFDKESLEELAASLKSHGLLQPILVQPQNGKYLIIAGERRYRAAKLADLKTIPCLIHEGTEQELAEKALIENIQRSDLSPVEEGLAYARLIKEFSLTQEEVAKRVGKSRSTITNLLRILQLPDPILNLINERSLSLGHAKVLLGVKDTSLQVLLAEKTVRDQLSVRDLEGLLEKYSNKEKPEIRKREDYTFANIEDKLRTTFQTKVKVQGTAKRGKVVVEYFSEDEFNRLLDIWNIEVE
ncbi:MAG: ParB/RepB/Spo0J family partition protein [Desulfitobacterium sp.]|nr:ParB/RepB/Spo0J family partition protein [Desulfitobacterium sp.]